MLVDSMSVRGEKCGLCRLPSKADAHRRSQECDQVLRCLMKTLKNQEKRGAGDWQE